MFLFVCVCVWGCGVCGCVCECSLMFLWKCKCFLFFLYFLNQLSKWRILITEYRHTQYKTHTHRCAHHIGSFCLLDFATKCEFIKYAFYLVWLLVLIRIQPILKQQIINKRVSKNVVEMCTSDIYTSAKTPSLLINTRSAFYFFFKNKHLSKVSNVTWRKRASRRVSETTSYIISTD